jgi:hypothetical protein
VALEVVGRFIGWASSDFTLESKVAFFSLKISLAFQWAWNPPKHQNATIRPYCTLEDL